MILESLITTLDASGQVNLAPLGPIVVPHPLLDRDAADGDPLGDAEHWPRFLLRPWRGSRTCENLLTTGRGVIHVTDDVGLIARTAIGRVDAAKLTMPLDGEARRFFRLVDCHRWFAVEVESLPDRDSLPTEGRLELAAACVNTGLGRPWFGLNRARHAVVELAVLATRLDHFTTEEIRGELRRQEVAVEKTAGPKEQAAFDLLCTHIAASLAQRDSGKRLIC